MTEAALNDLETKVDRLIALLEHAKLENASLLKQNAKLARENVELLEQKKKAVESLKALNKRLQDELSCQT